MLIRNQLKEGNPMRIPRQLHILPSAIQSFIILAAFQPLTSYAADDWCKVDSTPGVLISGHVTKGGFACYMSHLLTENMPYVILVAVVLVVVSGIQYMLSQGQPAAQGAAKTRIIGILTGVIFYFLLRYLLPLVVGGISL
jgi:hypothetical protein